MSRFLYDWDLRWFLTVTSSHECDLLLLILLCWRGLSWWLCALAWFLLLLDNLSSSTLLLTMVVHSNRYFPLIVFKSVEIFHSVSRRSAWRCSSGWTLELIVCAFALKHLSSVFDLIYCSHVCYCVRLLSYIYIEAASYSSFSLLMSWCILSGVIWRFGDGIARKFRRRRFRLEKVLWNVGWHIIIIAAFAWWMSLTFGRSYSSHHGSTLLVLRCILH